MLKVLLDNGIKIDKIHCVVAFDQSPFAAKYINKCISERAKSTSEFEKLMYKNCMNSIFGKFAENVRRFITTKLVKQYTYFLKYASDFRFNNARLINDRLSLMYFKKDVIYLDRFPSCAYAILEVWLKHAYQ